MKKLLLTLLTFLIAVNVAYPQLAIRHRLATPRPADSLDIDYYSHKRGLQAGTMVFGINMGVWAFDRYIRKADFAYINGRTIKDNLKHGFVWDNDAMGTNMFMHPYHGSLYFNSARSNGYNFWQSGLFAFGGSFMWEMFMENEYPSTNDIIATPIGGMALGEVTYRVSDLILDDRKTGWSRFGLEFAGFLVSPMRGLTRIINGYTYPGTERRDSGQRCGSGLRNQHRIRRPLRCGRYQTLRLFLHPGKPELAERSTGSGTDKHCWPTGSQRVGGQ